MTDHAYTDAIGHGLQASDWCLIAQSRFDQFADVTLEHQYIHIDPVRATLTNLRINDETEAVDERAVVREWLNLAVVEAS